MCGQAAMTCLLCRLSEWCPKAKPPNHLAGGLLFAVGRGYNGSTSNAEANVADRGIRGKPLAPTQKGQDMPEELKPCPFCGKRPLRIPLDVIGTGRVYITCANDSCSVNPSTYAVSVDKEQDAWDAWNVRK
jgi:hypothetical protein